MLEEIWSTISQYLFYNRVFVYSLQLEPIIENILYKLKCSKAYDCYRTFINVFFFFILPKQQISIDTFDWFWQSDYYYLSGAMCVPYHKRWNTCIEPKPGEFIDNLINFSMVVRKNCIKPHFFLFKSKHDSAPRPISFNQLFFSIVSISIYNKKVFSSIKAIISAKAIIVFLFIASNILNFYFSLLPLWCKVYRLANALLCYHANHIW